MERRFGWFLCCALSICLASGSVVAQGAKVKPVPRAETYVLPAAELPRVDEGVFEIPVDGTIDLTDRRIFLSIRSYRDWPDAPRKCCNLLLNVGGTIDLTDRKILLSVTSFTSGREKKCCTIMLNGDRIPWRTVGHRFDLKQLRATRQSLDDKNQCFLDIVDVATPKGAPWLLTFRLHCP